MLKLIAPFRALFSLDSSLIAANPPYFRAFLRHLQGELENPDSDLRKQLNPAIDIDVHVPAEPSESEIGSRYIGLNANGSLYLSPRVFTLRFKPEAGAALNGIYKYAAEMADEVAQKYSRNFFPDLASLRVDFQDNTIATFSLDMVIDRTSINKSDHGWNRLDEWTTVLVHFILARIYPDFLFPIITALKQFSDSQGYIFIQDVSDYSIFPDLVGDPHNPHPNLDTRFILLWVNRTLCYSGDYSPNHWMKQLMHGEANLKIREAEFHLNAGNSIIAIPETMDKAYLAQFWDINLSAQYYYAALDAVNINLVKYIGTIFNRQTNRDLRRLTREMEAIINRVTILQVRYHDFSMELQGTARRIFALLQKEWDFGVLANNVHRKLELCKNSITILNQETNTRNQGRTEIVLTSLTGLGVLNLFVELGNYATQMPKENRDMVGNIPGFMDLGFIMSGNALSWIGIVIAVGAVIFAVANRRA